jgi:hypothetical protein
LSAEQIFIAIVAIFGIFVAIKLANKPHVPTTRELYDQSSAAFPTPEEFFTAFLDRMLEPSSRTVWPITEAQSRAIETLYDAEEFERQPFIAFPEGTLEEGRYRDQLLARLRKSANPEKTIQVFSDALWLSFGIFNLKLPPLVKDDRYFAPDGPKPPFTVPLIDVVPDAAESVLALRFPFFTDQVESLDLFKSLREKLQANQAALTRNSSKPIGPSEFTGTAGELVDAYLKGTPLATLFDADVPFEIPAPRLLEHAVLVAGSGHGKTQTLGALIARFIQENDPPALVVIDSTGALVKKIETLAVFNDRLKDRIVIIDPEHEPSPALNMFDVSNARMRGYSESMRASVETEIVQLFNYIFTSAQNDLTSRQGTVFSYVVRLVLSMPGSTIDTLRQVLEDDPKGGYANSRYRAAIEMLDATAQDFFKNQYFGLKGFREQIAQRVYGLVQVPAFQRMFASNNKVDFFDELQNRGSIIVVNTSESLLKQDASTLFGRYIIARTMAAAFERASIPQEKRRPTFLIVDEAAPYFDDTFDKLLTRVRQFKLGVCVAFQHMEQASEKLRSSIASNTSVKLAGGLGYTDSRWLSRDMETTPEFLKAQKRDNADPPQWTQLACYVRNYTPHAVSITVPFYALEKLPQMTSAEHRALLERNRVRVSSSKLDINPPPSPEPARAAANPPQSPPATEEQTRPAPPPSAQKDGDDDAAAEWQ